MKELIDLKIAYTAVKDVELLNISKQSRPDTSQYYKLLGKIELLELLINKLKGN